ncbi:MAG: class II aldolase/adducin family protein [Verrucomicrobiales bacterium]|nr:class II aldolase/adducin family protein [Verrucomicrobiales bacterium]MCP5526100.1 class II aldolase/adducin family protein [Verrucomicrobiales bacterium]
MKKVISARDVEEMRRLGQDLAAIPSDSILTPSARDLLRDLDVQPAGPAAATGPGKAASAPSAPPAKALNSKSSKAELEAFFNSPWCQQLKEQICDVGRRLWQRAYVDGNGGNIAIRVGDDIALCTPTLVSKGFMQPADLCLVDFEGNQLAGVKKRTSEILMHLQMMKRQPKAVATVHCHPPYSTAFAVAGVTPPTCMIPEYEVFASVAIAPYRTPGTPEMGQLVADLVDKHNTILMANHGVVTWSHNNVEDAYFKMEILEAYCRTVMVTTQLGKAPNTMTGPQLKDLLKIKEGLGIPDPRFGLKECELCDNDEWRPGVTCAIPPKAAEPATAGADAEAEKLVQAITDQILAGMK